MSSTKPTGAFGSSLRGALRSDAGIHRRCSGCEPQYFDRRELVMRVPKSAESPDRVHVSPQIGWGAKRLLAMHLR